MMCIHPYVNPKFTQNIVHIHVPAYIGESVDSLCRDGTDTPYTQYKIKLSKSLQRIKSKLL